MIIDLHAHYITPGMLDRHDFWGPRHGPDGLQVGHWSLGAKTVRPQPGTPEHAEAKILWAQRWTLESRLQMMDAKGIDKLIVSTPAHMYMYWAGDFGDEYAQIINDELGALAASAPDRIGFWGHANLANPPAAAKEIERAVRDLGAKGMSMGAANFGGLEAYDRALFPVWEKICELNVPIFCHGYNQSVSWGERAMDDPFDTTSIVGMCYDEARLFWYLINGGVLDEFPELQVYITHGGGFIPYQLGRFRETSKTMAPDSLNKKPIEEYLPNFFFDLDLHSQAMRQAVLQDFGVDRLLYGTNFGGADSHDGDLTDGLGLSEAQREQIRSGNALKLGI